MVIRGSVGDRKIVLFLGVRHLLFNGGSYSVGGGGRLGHSEGS